MPRQMSLCCGATWLPSAELTIPRTAPLASSAHSAQSTAGEPVGKPRSPESAFKGKRRWKGGPAVHVLLAFLFLQTRRAGEGRESWCLASSTLPVVDGGSRAKPCSVQGAPHQCLLLRLAVGLWGAGCSFVTLETRSSPLRCSCGLPARRRGRKPCPVER